MHASDSVTIATPEPIRRTLALTARGDAVADSANSLGLSLTLGEPQCAGPTRSDQLAVEQLQGAETGAGGCP